MRCIWIFYSTIPLSISIWYILSISQNTEKKATLCRLILRGLNACQLNPYKYKLILTPNSRAMSHLFKSYLLDQNFLELRRVYFKSIKSFLELLMACEIWLFSFHYQPTRMSLTAFWYDLKSWASSTSTPPSLNILCALLKNSKSCSSPPFKCIHFVSDSARMTLYDPSSTSIRVTSACLNSTLRGKPFIDSGKGTKPKMLGLFVFGLGSVMHTWLHLHWYWEVVRLDGRWLIYALPLSLFLLHRLSRRPNQFELFYCFVDQRCVDIDSVYDFRGISLGLSCGVSLLAMFAASPRQTHQFQSQSFLRCNQYQVSSFLAANGRNLRPERPICYQYRSRCSVSSSSNLIYIL